MKKRYQVFVSSTFDDLKREREAVAKTLLKLKCIPAAMEQFPAVDQDQFDFITDIIDDCDFYLLIIAGRYGTLTTEGVSYTEKEFKYAVEQKIPVVALIHGKPEDLAAKHSENTQEAREKLGALRELVSTGRLVNYWSEPGELPGLVATSMAVAMQMFERPGWVRGGEASAETLSELYQLQKGKARLEKELTALHKQLAEARSAPIVENLAGLSETTPLSGTYDIKTYGARGGVTRDWDNSISWLDILDAIGTLLMTPTREHDAGKRLALYIVQRLILKMAPPVPFALLGARVNAYALESVRVQLLALSLIKVNDDLWSLTPGGLAHVMETRTSKARPLSD